MEKINFINGQAPALNGTNLNKIQENIEEEINNFVNVIYPVGSIYKSTSDTDPSTLFGGTWEAIKSSDLIDSGLTSSNDFYRLYSDGYCEIRGARPIPDLQANTGHDEVVNLDFDLSNGLGVQGVISTGGANWANAELKIMKGTNTIILSIWNNQPTATENIVVDFIASGYVTNITPIYAWKRIS